MTTVNVRWDMRQMNRRFLDRSVADALKPMTRRFFMRAGGAIRTTARRSLRRARRMRPSEMTTEQRERHQRLLRQFRAGRIIFRPQLPEAISRPGEPPRLHQKPTSLLKDRLFFALAPDSRSVVIGPEAVGRNKRLTRQGQLSTLQELEQRRPFMAPAFALIEPQFPQFLAAAR